VGRAAAAAALVTVGATVGRARVGVGAAAAARGAAAACLVATGTGVAEAATPRDWTLPGCPSVRAASTPTPISASRPNHSHVAREERLPLPLLLVRDMRRRGVGTLAEYRFGGAAVGRSECYKPFTMLHTVQLIGDRGASP
jgi:hypothetical protein